MLRFLTAGESHGEALAGILEGMPSGVMIHISFINNELARRQKGYGRGRRMAIEQDKAEILSGLRNELTLGSPVALLIKNKDWTLDKLHPVTRPRPGHADLAGAIKYHHTDIRNVLERASARETAMRVAIGAVCKQFIKEFGIEIISHVLAIGGVKADTSGLSFEKVRDLSSKSSISCADLMAEKLMIKTIDEAIAAKDSLGGVFEVIARGCPVGLGSYAHYDRRMNGILAQSLMSIQAIKAVEIGSGIESAQRRGSGVHDEIFYKKHRGFFHRTNRAGGIEGGMTNGEDVVLRCFMKPIATLGSPLSSVDIISKKPFKAAVERSDICAVPAAAVVGEAQVAFELARALCEKFGGDSLVEMKRNYKGYEYHISRIYGNR
ncbi:MAG: chorismate synthase [Candidatus Omnitrophica bacterium]|nr:chorismate synthase [Candidatus Omnitrophota bacterium]